MPVLAALFRRTLNSVPFGIATMVAIALYIAVGSGWVGLRERLEMDELLFFNWWPLKLLIVLLIANLITVTVTRIPLTPPRYGVWCIHMGIILLCMSLSAYYSLKTEGLTYLEKGRTVDYYYDRWDRALYVRTQFATSLPVPLHDLPRFREYDEPFNNAAALDRRSLRDLQPRLRMLNATTRQSQWGSLHESLGLKDPVKIDVIAYYPYATSERYRVDPTATNTGLRLSDAKNASDSRWMVANQAADSVIAQGPVVIEHRHLPTQGDVNVATGEAKRLHKLSLKVGDLVQETFVEPGATLEIGTTGYTVHVEGFTPQFPLSDGSGKADLLTVMVTKNGADGQPAREFRRQIIAGKDQQTDFELGVEGAGPFGKRKRDGLLDNELHLTYAFTDPTKLLPTMEQATVKYLLYTATDTPGFTMLRVSSREASVTMGTNDPKFDLHLVAPPPMLGMGGGEQDLGTVNIQRVDNVAPSAGVVAVPRDRQNQEVARGGVAQMLRVRVRCGDWSSEFPVPYEPFAAEHTWNSTPKIRIPGTTGDFQLALGNERLPMPMSVRLDNFEPVPYAGGDTSRAGVMRDFRSTITLINRETGEAQQQTASLNNPAFFELPSRFAFIPGQSWLLSQAKWDPGDHTNTTLQIGNRPAVRMMIIACVMIFSGLLYAFYAKPLIIRRMKRNALLAAQAKKQRVRDSIEEPNSSPLAPVIGGEG